MPGNYSTIQSAIDAAYGGDTIVVSDGTYSENIDFTGKNVTVESVNGAASTTIQGDGINSGSSVTITNCNITGNITTGSLDGGGIYNCATISVMNSTIAGNYPARYGGGIRHQSGTATFTNCIIWGNTAASNGPNISGTPTVTYSDVEGGFAGTGNIDSNPLFVNLQQASAGNPTTAGDFHIQSGSPVVDHGTASGAPGTDIDGDTRPMGAGIDMGSDEKE